jgi:hypothetical protein
MHTEGIGKRKEIYNFNVVDVLAPCRGAKKSDRGYYRKGIRK